MKKLPGKLLVFTPEGKQEMIALKPFPARPPLEELQRLVGGYIEVVPDDLYGISDPVFDTSRSVVLVNEEGRLIPLPLNHYAMKLIGSHKSGWGELWGNVVVIDKELFG